ncbi:MAG: hypothetical protein ACTSWN_15755 [Promethearchaeota archaeon]
MELAGYSCSTELCYGNGVESIFSACSILLAFQSIKRYRAKRNATTIKIIVVFAGFMITSYLTAFGKALVISGAYPYDVVEYKFFIDAFAIMTIMIANTAFFSFTLDVFYNFTAIKKKVLIIIYLFIELVVVAFGVFLWVVYDIITEQLYLILNILVMAIVFALSIFTYVLMLIRAIQVAKKSEGFDKISMHLMGLSALLILCFFMCFGADVLNLFGLGNISIIYFLAFGFAFASIIITYLGYFRPRWFQERLVR